MKGFEIAEITCPTKYSRETSSINFGRGFVYGAEVLWVSSLYRLHKWELIKRKIYQIIYRHYKYRISSNLLVRSCDMRLDN